MIQKAEMLRNLSEQQELTNKLDQASKLYYNSQTSEYSDTQFDLELKRLQAMEKANAIVLPNSPTLRVGSDLREEFGKVEHPKGYPMLTIENCYNDEELLEWMRKMKKTYNVDHYNVSLKYDGISCELHYQYNMLVTGSTRGDRLIGDDITENVKTVKSIPLSIPKFETTYVRGELLMPKSELKRINEEREKNGEKPFANCRNACSGSVKQLDSRITAQRGLIFRPWDIMIEDYHFFNQTDKKDAFFALGFTVDPGTEPLSIYFSEQTVEECLEKIKTMWAKAKEQDYDCDGIVIKVDNCAIQEEIGTKDHRAIEWGIARKWNEENVVTTELIDVDWQVGRTGVVTPVGKLDPVECDGVTISNVTLNNVSFIKKFDIHYGNDLVITRSGGVIPYVMSIKHDLLMEMNGAYKKVEVPDFCPCCGAKLVMDGEILRCPNTSTCNAQLEGRIEQWCAKDCMDIPQVGPSMIHDLVEKNLVGEPLEMYYVADKYSVNELVDILGEGYGTKSIRNFINNVKASKARTFDRVLYGLSIPGIGKQNAKMLADYFGSYDRLLCATSAELMEIEGIGPNLTDAIINWFAHHTGIKEKLLECGLATEMDIAKEKAQNEQILQGLNIVFSGKSTYWDGDEVEEVFTSYGAKCGHSISKKTNYLVIGEKPGPSKLTKAKDLGIEIVFEKDFVLKFNIPIINENSVSEFLPDPPSIVTIETDELF